MKNNFNGILTILLTFFMQFTFAQEKTITGTVKDASGPLPGASIVIKGTSKGTETDFDGNYSIKANTGDVLVFSFVGLTTVEKTVGSESKIDVLMSEDENLLQEVVITAVGIKRKPDEITTANQVVKADELNQASNPDAVQALAGKVSGLQINTTSNGLNPNSTITLRGTRSISGNNSALVVIDNIISTQNVLSTLDPNTIESINVMKGANGAALYGERGASGVIIVTTKKGTKDAEKLSVDFKTSLTLEEIALLPETQDRFGQGWSGTLDWTDQGSWGTQYDGTLQVTGTPDLTTGAWRLFPYEHIEDNILPFFTTGTNFQNSVSLSGGNLKNGFLNFSYLRQDIGGVIPNDSRIKNNFSLTTGKTFNKFSIQVIARYTTDEIDRANGALYERLANTPGNIPIEQFDSGNNNDHWTLFDTSPYWTRQNDRFEGISRIIDLSADLQYKFNDHISTILRSSIRNTNSEGQTKRNGFVDNIRYVGNPRDIRSQYFINTSNDRFVYTDLITNFDYKLTDDITFKSNIGFNMTDAEFGSLNVGGNDLRIDNFFDLSNVSNVIQYNQIRSRQRTMGIFGNFDFGYKDYLFLNITARNDWNSVLPKANRSFFYPSVGVAFIPTKAIENLKSKFLHKIKVSASYVRTGNAAALAAHEVIPTAPQAPGYPYFLNANNSFVLERDNVDPNIKNEFITNFEGNINLELLNIRGPRITLDASYTSGKNSDQLLNITNSSATGFYTTLTNIGETTSTSLELDLGFTPLKTENFEFNGRVGFSTYKTVVNKVTDDSNIVTLTNGLSAVEGEEFPVIRGTAYSRDDKGRVILDSNGNPIRSSELKVLGKTTPDYILNFAASFRYKRIRLNAVADYRTGHVFYSGIRKQLSYQGRTIQSTSNNRLPFLFPNSTVQGTGTDNTTVLTTAANAEGAMRYYQNNYDFFDENFITDATAFKLREVSLSYDLPEKIVSSLGLTKFNVGASGRNLLILLPDENKDYNDPEFGNGIGDYSFTPPTRFYTLNVNVAF
ncbi:SusC/RagA family TonB-linked outer membrane protein [Tenacibaculum amylolyticum]|uniref:SusC/RagA family TonB-linked outer membrane protein n=1 Tax=Tenacibaculum amylolyticum TaxID=104269 RepID=UPI0038959241